MRAGVAKADVTPQEPVDLAGFYARVQPMAGVLDPLHVRCVAFEDAAGAQAVLAVADSLAAPDAVLQRIRQACRERLALEPANVHLACTHTHSAPCLIQLRDAGDVDPNYVDLFVERTVACAEEALRNLRPARMAVSRCEVDLAVDRRQGRDKLTRPPQLDPEVLTLCLYEDDPSRPFAALVNCGCHAVIMRDRRVSADWPGAACQALEAIQGEGFDAVVLVGASGNLNPTECGEPPMLEAMGRALGEAVVRAPRAPIDETGPVTTRSAPYRLRFLAPDPAELEADARELADGATDADGWHTSCLRWARDRLADMRAGELQEQADLTLHVLAVGDMRFAFAPFEVFSETGRAVKAAAPGRVLMANCGDGIHGYLPIRSAYGEGGYEVSVAPKFYDSMPPAAGSAEEIAGLLASLV